MIWSWCSVDNFTTANSVTVLFVASLLVTIYVNGKEWKKKVFAYWYVRSQESLLQGTGKFRKALFANLNGLHSKDKEMAKHGGLRILEIGVGPCCNLEYYPTGSHLVSVDPNENFMDCFNKNKAKYPDIVLEAHHIGFGEDMSQVPDESVDVVVGTYVFCSVKNVPQVLKEAYRVLVPGGKLYFLEHVASKRPVCKLAQKLIQPLWSVFTDDCQLTVPSLQYIKESEFKIEFYKHVLATEVKNLPCVWPNLMGIARKNGN